MVKYFKIFLFVVTAFLAFAWVNTFIEGDTQLSHIAVLLFLTFILGFFWFKLSRKQN